MQASASLLTGSALFLTQQAMAVPAGAPPSYSDPGQGMDSFTVNRTDGTVWPFLQYVTEPTYNPPLLNITANGKPLSDGYLFFDPTGSTAYTKEFSGLIMTDKGDLVYNGVTVNGSSNEAGSLYGTNNFRTQMLNGTQYITYWEGTNTDGNNIGHGYGAIRFLDSTYQTKYYVCPKLGLAVPDNYNATCQADIHEQLVTPQGTLLITAYNATPYDLTPVGGPKDGWIYNPLFYEVTIPDGKVLFNWSAIEHQSITASKQPLQGTGQNFSAPWDWFHINSVDYVDELDAYLVNSRHTWTTFLVSQQTGKVMWEIQGDDGGDFGTLPSNGHFRWQHDARAYNASKTGINLSWFNNYNSQVNMNGANGSSQTVGLEMHLPLPPNKNTPVTVLEHLTVASEPLFAASQGRYAFQGSPQNFQTQFMDYGQIPVMREYGLATDGSDLRWEARFGQDTNVQSYRAYKNPWYGQPTTAPKLVVKHGSNNATGYVSWNGATNVTGWAVYEGASSSSLTQTGVVPKRGFETSFTPAASSKCVQVAAVEGGKQVKKSNLACS